MMADEGWRAKRRLVVNVILLSSALLLGGCRRAPQTVPNDRPLQRIVVADRDLSVAYAPYQGKEIVVERSGERQLISAVENYSWGEPIVTPNGSFLFVIAYKSYSAGYSTAEAVFRIKMPGLHEPFSPLSAVMVLSCDLPAVDEEFADPSISKLYAASEDGKRLLTLVGYTDRVNSNDTRTVTKYRPFFVDIESGALTPVVP